MTFILCPLFFPSLNLFQFLRVKIAVLFFIIILFSSSFTLANSIETVFYQANSIVPVFTFLFRSIKVCCIGFCLCICRSISPYFLVSLFCIFFSVFVKVSMSTNVCTFLHLTTLSFSLSVKDFVFGSVFNFLSLSLFQCIQCLHFPVFVPISVPVNVSECCACSLPISDSVSISGYVSVKALKSITI